MVKTTTERGLGADHQRQRRLLLPFAYGKPCPLCGELMAHGQKLDLDHVVMRMFGGSGGPVRMAHEHCNRRLGAIIGNRTRAAWRQTARRAVGGRW